MASCMMDRITDAASHSFCRCAFLRGCGRSPYHHANSDFFPCCGAVGEGTERAGLAAPRPPPPDICMRVYNMAAFARHRKEQAVVLVFFCRNGLYSDTLSTLACTSSTCR